MSKLTPSPVRVLIVDDEPPARRRLARLVAEVGSTVIGEAGDADEALDAIRRLDPDVVLLDIRMPGTDGVTLARMLDARPIVVFTTAHAEFALDAFDAAAIDYLLKPISRDKLARALDRARARMAAVPAAPPRLIARTGDRIDVHVATAITRFWSDEKYTAFAAGGAEHLLDESLNTLEERLVPWGFVRVHRGELIQLARIRRLRDAGDGAIAELDDGQEARVSRRSLPDLRRRLAGS